MQIDKMKNNRKKPDFLRLKTVVVCAILSLWGHGNQKTDTNIYYSTILFCMQIQKKTAGIKTDIEEMLRKYIENQG